MSLALLLVAAASMSLPELPPEVVRIDDDPPAPRPKWRMPPEPRPVYSSKPRELSADDRRKIADAEQKRARRAAKWIAEGRNG